MRGGATPIRYDLLQSNWYVGNGSLAEINGCMIDVHNGAEADIWPRGLHKRRPGRLVVYVLSHRRKLAGPGQGREHIDFDQKSGDDRERGSFVYRHQVKEERAETSGGGSRLFRISCRYGKSLRRWVR